MSWLQNLTSGLSFRNLLTPEAPPNKVLEVRSENYSERPIVSREDALVLYGPRKDPAYKDKYELILNRPFTETLNQAYSLYRAANQEDGELKFSYLKGKLPCLLIINREANNPAGIQKICDLLHEHSSWTLAHVCAALSYECFTDPNVQRFINATDNFGITPLFVAIYNSNLRVVQLLIELGAKVDQIDSDGNSVFHAAAITNKEIIGLLASSCRSVMNLCNLNGHTPLHVACMADNPECVRALLTEGADVNIPAVQTSDVHTSSTSTSNTEPGYVGNFYKEHAAKLFVDDMKFGGTPLHWASSREVAETLIDMGCDLNAPNFNGQTALHVMVKRKRLGCVMALLSRHALINVGDPTGNTPLHLAVQEGNMAIVQALIVFGAECGFLNNEGETPRHQCPTTAIGEKILYLLHAVGSPRCPVSMTYCHRGCKFSEDEGFNGTPPAQPPVADTREVLDQMLTVAGMNVAATSPHKRNSKGGRVLCLDGGGIRGLVLVTMLIELESVLEGKRVVDCFDWIAGTSTGGIMALALASGKTLRECMCLYFRMKDQAFLGGRPYPSEPLEKILKETLGSQITMSELVGPKLIITGVLADRKPVDLHLFRNYVSPKDMLKVPARGIFLPADTPQETKVWQAARASGAAPSYFRAFGRYLDGGLISNNPTLDVLTEIHEFNLALLATGHECDIHPPTVVVSLGTGIIPLSELKAIDVFRPESIFDTARLYMGVTALGTLLVDQATASDGRVVDRARAWCSMIGVPYYRFSPRMSEDLALDEKNDEKLVNMMWEAKAYMHSNMSQLSELALFLLEC